MMIAHLVASGAVGLFGVMVRDSVRDGHVVYDYIVRGAIVVSLGMVFADTFFLAF